MPLLDVRKLSTRFYSRGLKVDAVKNSSFHINAGETLAIVGESGSGKSVSCYSLLKLLPAAARVDAGSAYFEGQDLLSASEAQLRQLRGNDIAMIFQDPMTSLNPLLTIGEQLAEPLREHQKISRRQARIRAIAALSEVGIDNAEQQLRSYPHEFSGGMRQRVMIAMALISDPKLLIADEPTTALDVTLQAQIISLIRTLQRRRKLAVIFISHDLNVVAAIADRVAVMRQGEIVEQGSTHNVLQHSQHPYTRELLAAIPQGAKTTSYQQPSNGEPLLEVKQLSVHFNHSATRRGFFGSRQTPAVLKAVDNISLELYPGEILGLVGESGSGKSTLGRAIMQLQASTQGSVSLQGCILNQLPAAALRQQRRHFQMIFQDPYASLNPRMTVFATLAEPLLLHGMANSETLAEQVYQLMDDVGLARRYSHCYPHEFSGGQRQRIAIGRAIACRPSLIIADEPVSALDVTIQAKILQLLQKLATKYGLSMLFITHDLAVVRLIADRLLVMHRGKIIEQGVTETLLAAPQHDYTLQLLAANPKNILSNSHN